MTIIIIIIIIGFSFLIFGTARAELIPLSTELILLPGLILFTYLNQVEGPTDSSPPFF